MSQPNSLKILIADDHAMILEMFEMYLSSVSDISLDTVQDLPAALQSIDANGPYDLVLVDLNMPGMDGALGLQKALTANGGKPVGILTSSPSQKIVDEVIAMGGAGIMLKTASLKNFVNEVRLMAGGGRYLPVELLNRAPQEAATGESVLSKREFGVLQLLAAGKLNREIGEELGLAEPTVKMHVKSICRKLGATNRTQAVVVAQERGLL